MRHFWLYQFKASATLLALEIKASATLLALVIKASATLLALEIKAKCVATWLTKANLKPMRHFLIRRHTTTDCYTWL